MSTGESVETLKRTLQPDASEIETAFNILEAKKCEY